MLELPTENKSKQYCITKSLETIVVFIECSDCKRICAALAACYICMLLAGASKY
jgi:hypothetical protein